MKKQLISAAVAGLISAPALAQVTVYGNVETGILSQDVSGSPTAANNVSTTLLLSNLINSSRLGFRGTEDIGGGLKAFFRLEQSVDLRSGSLGGQTTTSAGMFDRGAEVGLEGSFGAIKIGKYDLTATEGIDTAYSQMGNVGNFVWANSLRDIGTDVDHSIQYSSPSIGGFIAQIGTSLKDGNGGSDIVSYSVNGRVSGVSLAIGFSSSTRGAAEQTQTAMGASYNFGPVTIGATYSTMENTGQGNQKNTVVSAVAPLFDGLSVHGVVLNAKLDAFGTTKASETEKIGVALSKAFSKRTVGYLAYVSTDTNGVETNQMYLAVNHRF